MSTNPTPNTPSPLQPPAFVMLLAHEIRWGVVKALMTSDLQVHELVSELQQPMNLVSYHLKKMRDDALVTTRRSEADRRDVYYSVDLDRLHQLYAEAGTALHPAMRLDLPAVDVSQLPAVRILCVCTHNSARSQIAEGLLRHLSQGRLHVMSAGNHPTEIHSEAVRVMSRYGIDLRQQRARHLEEFAGQSFDYVITVCDKAREVCPIFPGEGRQMHWGFPDPVALEDDAERAAAFEQTAISLRSRIGYFLSALSAERSS